jgi:nicotinate-nucleotide adenylyltransferase
VVSDLESTAWQGAIGVFGGTFDPVHFGHLRAAVEAREKLGVDDFRLLPAGRPAHRAEPFADAEQRLQMLRLAVSGCPGLRVDDREVRRSGFSFMVDTLEELRGEAGPAPLLLLIGQDAANALDGWHEWRRLFDLAHIVVMRRPEAHFNCRGELREHIESRRTADPSALRDSAAGLVLPLEITQLDISSTFIRALLAQGRSPRFLLPERVIDYIREQGLYLGA